MSFIFGGGGSSGGGTTSGTQVSIAREAPEVESRKLALYDQAAKLASTPVGIPAFQVAGPSGLEQTGFTQAAQTGVGSQATTAGIGSVLGAQQTAAGAPNIAQFMNPYQQYVTDEIARQGQMAQNQLSAQAIGAGAFGGAREGIQQQAGQLLGALGGQQQAMQQGDIQSLLQAGGIQRQLGQQALEASRQTQLARSYEPYQRLEFLKGIMTNLPTTQSAVTATTAPGTNPLAQAAGAGIGAYAAYNMARR